MSEGVTHPSLVDCWDNVNHIDLALEAANAGAWGLNFQTMKFQYSPSVLSRLSECDLDKMSKLGLWAIIDKRDVTNISKQWQRIIDGTAKFDLVYRVNTKNDGLMWQRSIGTIIRDDQNNPLSATAIVLDISEQIVQERKLSDARQASDSQTNFLARISHEIRTPLNAIIGYTDSLDDFELSAEANEIIDLVKEQADDLNRFLTDILSYSKLALHHETANNEVVKLSDLALKLEKKWMGVALSKGLKFKCSVAQNAAETIETDPVRLEQCLNNILSNAFKFTHEGSVALVFKTVKTNSGDRLVIAVKDTGIGMSPNQIEKAKMPYTQARNDISREYGGTGLGLSIVNEIAKLLGVKLVIQSRYSEGTTVALVWPEKDFAEDLKAQSNTAVKEESTKTIHDEKTQAISLSELSLHDVDKLTILCVEDNTVNQDVVRRLLQKRVGKLEFASNGKEALEYLASNHADIVLMDVHMPVMNGIETTLEIRNSSAPWANIIIIALTADAEYQNIKLCKNIGMNDAIAKPVKKVDIFNAFERVFASLVQTHGKEVSLDISVDETLKLSA